LIYLTSAWPAFIAYLHVREVASRRPRTSAHHEGPEDHEAGGLSWLRQKPGFTVPTW